MQVQITEAADELHVAKFMPELVSTDELLMLADCYKVRIDTLNKTLHQHDKGSAEHFVLSDEMGGLVRRRRHLLKVARHRQKLERQFDPAQPKAKR